jgi:hypothetical protein
LRSFDFGRQAFLRTICRRTDLSIIVADFVYTLFDTMVFSGAVPSSGLTRHQRPGQYFRLAVSVLC